MNGAKIRARGCVRRRLLYSADIVTEPEPTCYGRGLVHEINVTERRYQPTSANARTGNVPIPRTRGGTAKKRKPAAGEGGQVREVLHDEDARVEQDRVHRPGAVGGVVDVERVDPDERRAAVAEPLRRVA